MTPVARYAYARRRSRVVTLAALSRQERATLEAYSRKQRDKQEIGR